MIGLYKPQYFQAVFPDFSSEFGLTNALITAVLGFISALGGGIISDNFRKDDLMTKTYICIASSLLSAPFITLALTQHDDFWFSIGMLAINYVLAESWLSPSITMLLDVTSVRNQGFTVNAFLLISTIAGAVSIALLDEVNTYVHAD